LAKKKHKKLKKQLLRQQKAGTNAGMGPNGQGLLGGLARLLPGKPSDQFLVGALLGAASAYVLADDALRGKLIRTGLNLYSSFAGGLEEVKEQVADIKAEMAAQQNGLI
jgi:hypothetical protein